MPFLNEIHKRVPQVKIVLLNLKIPDRRRVIILLDPVRIQSLLFLTKETVSDQVHEVQQLFSPCFECYRICSDVNISALFVLTKNAA